MVSGQRKKGDRRNYDWYNRLITSGIYLIVNNTNGKRYIGSSKNLPIRWRQHRSELRLGKHPNHHLQRAWNNDGECAFEFTILEYCPNEDLLEREDWWITLLHTRLPERGYNFWAARRHECSPETRAKLSKSMRGKIFSEEHRRNISLARIGMKFSESHIANNAAARIGIKFSDSHIENLRVSHTGKRMSDETRSRMSAAAKRGDQHHRYGKSPPNKGQPGNPPWNKGKACPPEMRSRISAAKRGQVPWNKGKVKTECSKGHPLSGYNLMILASGERRCRECSNENVRRCNRRKRDKAQETRSIFQEDQ